MSERRRLPQKLLRDEKHTIFQFVLSHLKPDPYVRGVPLKDIFEAYKKHHKTELTIDGFGRLFPKQVYPRKTINYDGKMWKSVVGVKIV